MLFTITWQYRESQHSQNRRGAGDRRWTHQGRGRAILRCAYLLNVSVRQATAAEKTEDEPRAVQRCAAAAELQRREVLMRCQQRPRLHA